MSINSLDARKPPLIIHLLRHIMKQDNGDKPYQCKECREPFSCSLYLRTHVIIHFGEKYYGYTKCSMFIMHSSSIALHVGTHGRDNTYIDIM